MKFRVVEFNQTNPTTGNRFFVEIGEPFKKHLFWFFYVTKIAWKPMVTATNEPHEGFKEMDKALFAISELKKQLPIYHNIK